MADAQDKFEFGDAVADAETSYEALREDLLATINQFADEEELSPGNIALLLVDIGVNLHMLGYVLTTERPSVNGLKLDLDRFRREIDDFIRSSKKAAEEFVPKIKEILATKPASDADDPRRVA